MKDLKQSVAYPVGCAVAGLIGLGVAVGGAASLADGEGYSCMACGDGESWHIPNAIAFGNLKWGMTPQEAKYLSINQEWKETMPDVAFPRTVWLNSTLNLSGTSCAESLHFPDGELYSITIACKQTSQEWVGTISATLSAKYGRPLLAGKNVHVEFPHAHLQVDTIDTVWATEGTKIKLSYCPKDQSTSISFDPIVAGHPIAVTPRNQL
jgi:hypothetical protein